MAKGGMHVLGLDIGTSAIKAAELQVSGGEVYLVGRPAVLPTPGGAVRGGVVVDAREVGEALQQLKSVYGMHASKVIASVGGDSSVAVRIAEVPKMAGKELDEAIQWELDEQTPFPVEEVIYDYSTIERADADPEATEMEVLLAVAQEDMVSAHVEAIMGAGMQPVAIDVEPLAIGRALVDVAGDEFAEQTAIVVHIGATSTIIAAFRQKLLSFVRLIPSGGENLTQAVSQTLMIDGEQAELVKVQLGNLGDGAYAAGARGPEFKVVDDARFEEGIEESAESDSVFELSADEESATIEAPDDRATHLEVEDLGDLELPPGEAGAAPEAEGPAQEEADTDLSYAQDQVAEALTDPVLDIATEVRRSIDFYRRQRRNEAIDRVFITGGTASLPGLAELVAEETGIATEVGDPFKHLIVDDEAAPQDYLDDIAPSVVIAVGLALRDMVSE